VDGLFFAGDTYVGRGLAIEGASRSAILCVERILG
jgi:prolycopene isomerase